MNPNEFIIETIKNILTLLGVAFTDVSLSVDEKITSQRFVVTTIDSSILIGEHGTRLLALNHVMKRIAEKKFPEEKLLFMIDVNDYQKKRVDEIRMKTHILAERARFFKSSVEMDPMSSYERMVVHAEFTGVADIVTESIGIGKDRRVVIKYSESKLISA